MNATSQAMTIAQVAAKLRIGKLKVRKLIADGTLEAFDLSTVGVGRRRLRIMPESLAEMLTKAAVKTRKTTRRRTKIDPEVERWLL